MGGNHDSHKTQEPFWTWWLAIHKDVVTEAYQILRSLEDAKDIAQEVAITASNRRDIFDGVDPLRSWATKRAKWLALNLLRRSRRLSELDYEPASPESFEKKHREDLSNVQSWIDVLPLAQQEVLTLDLEGLSTAEIAVKLQKNPRTIRSLRRHAITKIRRYLQQ